MDHCVAFGPGCSLHHVLYGDLATVLWQNNGRELFGLICDLHVRLLHNPAGLPLFYIQVQAHQRKEQSDGFGIAVGGLRKISVNHMLVNEIAAGMRQRVE